VIVLPRVRMIVVAVFAASAGAGSSTVTGLDHVPIAVADLERAAADYRSLGFALKAGRPHEDGIRNQHVKFRDGTELELITAPAATDALTRTYRTHLAAGDGPAFLALFAPDRDALARQLDAAHQRYTRSEGFVDIPEGDALQYWFFGGRNASPTDLPEHFAHANTAEALIGVWLAGDDLSHERRLLQSLGATLTDEQVRVPEATDATVAHFGEGDVVLLHGAHQLVRGRPIVGVTLRVRDIAVARRVVAKAIGRPLAAVVTGGRTSLFLPPDVTHGLWIELRTSRGQGAGG
jgi:catechol 2,3-dioxygenase-like lactoylglutathione lyase family enzyme